MSKIYKLKNGDKIDLTSVIPNNAGAHNSIYRGKDITNLFYNGTLSEQIAAGTFDDIFIGDYIIGKVSGKKYLVADINYRLKTGDTICKTNHVLMIPEKIMGMELMNETAITTGAYVGSKMYTGNLEKYKTIIKNDFELEHILTHRIYLQNKTYNGYENLGSWYNSEIDLMNETMLYGSIFLHNIINGISIPNNCEIDNSQLSIFRHKHDSVIAMNDNNIRQPYWLRDVVSDKHFAYVGHDGHTGYISANNNYRCSSCIPNILIRR